MSARRTRTSAAPRSTLAAAAAALTIVLGAGLAACSDDGRTLRPPSPDQTASILVPTTTAPAVEPLPPNDLVVSVPWVDAGEIPIQYTCKGDDVSPAIGWSTLPEGTVEIAITITDPDANDFVHWVVSGLDPAVGQVAQEGVPEEASQSLNDAGTVGYTGPCPPEDSGPHTYLVNLYALREPSGLAPGGDPRQAIVRLEQAALDVATATGMFPAAIGP